MHDDGAFGQVSAETHTARVADADSLRQHVIGHARKAVDELHLQPGPLQLEPIRLGERRIDGAAIGPCDNGQDAEDAVEIDAVGLDEPVAEQVESQIGVFDSRGCCIKIDLDVARLDVDTAPVIFIAGQRVARDPALVARGCAAEPGLRKPCVENPPAIQRCESASECHACHATRLAACLMLCLI